jgi:DNA-binding transcriptional regulator YdaS (Cro superfamily)
MSKKAILKACAAVGGQSALARKLSLGSQGTVSSWLMRGKLPAERVLEVEAVSGVSRHELRPDLYPREKIPARVAG